VTADASEAELPTNTDLLFSRRHRRVAADASMLSNAPRPACRAGWSREPERFDLDRVGYESRVSCIEDSAKAPQDVESIRPPRSDVTENGPVADSGGRVLSEVARTNAGHLERKCTGLVTQEPF